MTKAIFAFIAAVLLTLPLVLGLDFWTLQNQFIFTLPFLALLGIPHGAIDNVLFLERSSVSKVQFFSAYLAIIVFTVGLWLLWPVLAYVLFLLLSAYHFGQSQVIHYFSKKDLRAQLLSLVWGISLIALFINVNINEIQELTRSYSDFSALEVVHEPALTLTTFIVASTLTLGMLIALALRGAFSWEKVLMEVLVFGLIAASFYLMPLLLGFTLYFIILHSYKVLREEYADLKNKKRVETPLNFVKVLLPFSGLSFLGIGVLLLLTSANILQVSYGYLALIIVAAITSPHAFVMEKFYQEKPSE